MLQRCPLFDFQDTYCSDHLASITSTSEFWKIRSRTSKELDVGDYDHIPPTGSVSLKKSSQPNWRGPELFRTKKRPETSTNEKTANGENVKTDSTLLIARTSTLTGAFISMLLPIVAITWNASWNYLSKHQCLLPVYLSPCHPDCAVKYHLSRWFSPWATFSPWPVMQKFIFATTFIFKCYLSCSFDTIA